MKNVDVFAVLSLGAIGIGFFLAVFAYWLLSREQRVVKPRGPILKAINIYMVFAILLVMLGILGRFLDKHSIRKAPPAEVGQAIAGLSPATILALVTIRVPPGTALYMGAPGDDTKSVNNTLIDKKLARELANDELSNQTGFTPGTKFVYGIALTKLGFDARDYVNGMIEEVVKAN